MRLFSAAILTLVFSCCAIGQTYTLNTLETATNPGPTHSVALDGAGNLYFQNGRNVVLRLDVTTGVVTPVAGNGAQGFSGDNGPATSAQLNNPMGVAVDAVGNLYIADCGNQRIRIVTNGVITTVAGNGKFGFSGDNGPATSAQLHSPWGITVDSAGNLYIADEGNNRIRQVSNGVITTIAGNGKPRFSGDGGPATEAQLAHPTGIARDSDGALYIADIGNGRIRKVFNSLIATVAGNGTVAIGGDNGPATSAQLGYAFSVAADTAGNVYIGSMPGARIRKVSNGLITTVAGNGMRGFSGDNGPATSAQLDFPTDLAVDVAGNLYIADAWNFRVRKVSNGVITTVQSTIAGPPVARR